MNGRTACESAKKPVRCAIQMMRSPFRSQVPHDGADDLRDVLADQQGRHAAHREASGTQRIQLEAGALPFVAAGEDLFLLVRLQLHDDRLEQMLGSRRGIAAVGLESLVQHPLVRGVHVDEHQSFPRLRDDVDAVQLRDRYSERVFRFGQRLAHRVGEPPRAACVAVELHGRPRVACCRAPEVEFHWLRLGLKDRRGVRGRACSVVRLRSGQDPLHRAKHELMDLPAVAEAHLELRRMRVHVDQFRIQAQIQNVRGVPAVIQDVAISQPHCVHQQPVAHAAPVHEPELLIRLSARGSGQAHPPGDFDRPGGMPHGHGPGRKLLAENRRETCPLTAFGRDRRRVHCRPLAVAQPERHIEARQRQPLHQPRDMPKLGRLAADEPAPCRHIEEQVADLDRGALRMGSGPDAGHAAAVDVDLRRELHIRRAGDDPQPGNRPDGGQRLAPEAERRDGLEILQGGDLAGRMSGNRHRQLG